MTPRSNPDELLLDHLHALRALARRLTRDAHAAEDAVQDTLVMALTRAQRLAAVPPRAVGAWLGSILRNRVRERVREEARRSARESNAHADRSATAPPAADVAAELALHRRIVELVHELDEPYRQTVFLRYFRGWSAREIGAALGVPHKTVHTRLERAIARLRSRLDEGSGGRSAWWATLAMAGRRPVAATVFGGIVLMKMKVVLAVGVAIALLSLLPLLRFDGGSKPAAPPAVIAGAEAAARTGATHAGGDVRPGPLARGAVTSPDADPSGPYAGTTAREVRGIVRDFDGSPVAGVVVRSEPRPASAGAALETDARSAPVFSAADGSFVVPVPDFDGVLTVDSDAWVAIHRPWVAAGGEGIGDDPAEIVVAPCRRYAGTVVDPERRPVPDAKVVVALGSRLVPTRSVGGRVLALPNTLAAATTDRHGRFQLDRVGFVRGLRLIAERAPFRSGGVELPPTSTPDLVLTLEAASDALTVHGVVLDAAGRPVEGAWVAIAGSGGTADAVVSDGQGRFVVRWPHRGSPDTVRAVARGLGSVSVALMPGDDRPGWSADRPLLVQLAPAPAALRGRVVDADGEPVAGARVWTPDLTFFAVVPFEHHGRQRSREFAVEGLAAESNDALTVAATTAADGSFELRGLTPRRYALFALAPTTLAAAGPVWGAPGGTIELRITAPDPRAVAGRVLSRSGTPIAGVHVALGRQFEWQPPPREVEAWTGTGMRLPRAAHTFGDRGTTTDEEGRFAFEPVVVDGSFLRLSGESLFLTPPFQLASDLPLDALEIVVDARSVFHVELQGGETADAFSLVKPDGSHVPVFVRIDDAQMSLSKVPLVDGKSCEAYSFAGEVTLVLWHEDDEVRRTIVTLPEGVGHVVRP